MSACAVMMVKNEVDVVDATVRQLLDQCDEVAVGDNLSTDGTYELLLELAVTVPELRVGVDAEVGYYQSAKTTSMARQAFHRGHDWVVPADADEFWTCTRGRIGDVLDGFNPHVGLVRAEVFNHYATADDDDDPNPIRRLRWRTEAPLGLPKVAVRLWENVIVHPGNHAADPPPNATAWATGAGFEIRHFPYRSAEQFAAKAIQGNLAYRATDLPRGLGLHWREYGERIEAEGVERGGHDWFNRYFRYEHPTLAGRPGDPQPDRELAPVLLDPVPT